jgi:predicted lipoprotein
MLGRCSAGSALLLLALVSGCDKAVLHENVKPPQGAGGGQTPTPIRDGGIVIDEPTDASVDAAEADASLSEFIDDEPLEFSKANLIAAFGNCAMAAYRLFEQRALALDAATQAWVAESNDANAAAARSAFRGAMSALQRVELFRIGPAAVSSEPGGKGLRDELYAYPNTSFCKVDQDLVDKSYASSDFNVAISTIGRGLGAYEYLVYYFGTDNACATSSLLNTGGAWAALGSDELQRRRQAYAAAIAKDVAKHASELVAAFEPGQGDFLKELTSAGRGSKVYPSEQSALSAINFAMFYVEIEVKDYKLAEPLGISPNCGSGSTCPELVESQFARLSTSNLATNLAAFRSIFQGCGSGPDHAGLGFDDWLTAAGHAELAQSMLKALDGVEEAVRTLDPPIERAIVEDPAKLRAVYDALKLLTDPLKGQFVSVLDLGAPMAAEGDND